jgi:hypothetical protein
LTEKLGNDTTEAMFKYIDNKTERSVEATIKTLATKDDILLIKEDLANVRYDLSKKIGDVKEDLAKMNANLSTKIAESKADNIKWMFLFWIGQAGTTIAIIMLFLKK